MSRPPSRLGALGDPALQRRAVGDVDRAADRLDALGFQRGDHLVDAGLAAGADGDVAALVGQRLGDRLADAARGADHDRLLALQLQIHRPVLPHRRLASAVLTGAARGRQAARRAAGSAPLGFDGASRRRGACARRWSGDRRAESVRLDGPWRR